MSTQINLTEHHRQFLEDLDEYDGCMLVGKYCDHSIRFARSLERRGMVNIDTDEYGDFEARWDDEFHADWTRLQEEEFQRAQGEVAA